MTTPAPDEHTGRPGSRTNARFRVMLLGILVVALLASAGTLVWLLAERRGEADGVQSEREAVLRQTEQFVLRLNTYGPKDVDAQGHLTDYQQQVDAVITSKFAAAFEKDGLPIAEQVVAQAGYSRSVKVYGVGVESIDGDSAKAIVAAGMTGSYPDPQHPKNEAKRVESEPDILRWEVDLVRSGDAWLVDDYAPVNAEESR